MVRVGFSREELEDISIDYMSRKGYTLKIKNENQLLFTDGKEFNSTLLVLLFLMLLVGGFIYYLLAKTHKISVSISDVSGGLYVSAAGTTQASNVVAVDFLESLEMFNPGSTTIGYNIQEIKCPRCGSSLDSSGKKYLKCSFCGASVAVSELREPKRR